MKKFLLIIFCTIIFPLSAFSATLQEALKQTFDNNLELQAERKNLEIQQEVINMSRSDLLPTLTLTGKKNFEETNEITTQAGADASVTDVDTSSASIKLEQTLLDGSGRKTEYEKSKLGLNLTEASAPACVVISFVSSKFFLPVRVKVGNKSLLDILITSC